MYAPHWIDWVCINQADVQERTLQVQMVDQIYKRAQFSYVWLEEGSAGPKTVFKYSRRLCKSKTLSKSATFVNWYADKCYRLWIVNHPRLVHSFMSIDKQDLGAVQAVVDLAYHSGFSRFWTLQELVYAQYTRVLCDIYSLNFEKLIEFLILMYAVQQCIAGGSYIELR
jgi:hypothetical protein